MFFIPFLLAYNERNIPLLQKHEIMEEKKEDTLD